jgi:hypothetical protein
MNRTKILLFCLVGAAVGFAFTMMSIDGGVRWPFGSEPAVRMTAGSGASSTAGTSTSGSGGSVSTSNSGTGSTAGTSTSSTGGSAAGTSAAGTSVGSRPAAVSLDADPNVFGGNANAVVKAVKSGIELKSTFNPATAAANVEGAGYVQVAGSKIPSYGGRKVILELDATVEGDAAGQSTEFQYVQNGLGQSGWKRFPLKSGRQVYRFEYAAPADNRPSSKSDTFWVRSDTDGRGRPLIVHALRIYVE